MGATKLAWLFGVAILAAGAQESLASTIDVTYKGSARGYATGYVTPSPNGVDETAHVSIGGEKFHNNTGTNYDFVSAYDNFVAWCVDPLHWTQSSYTYNVGGTSEMLAGGFAADRVHDLQILANNFYGGVNDWTSSAAFQVATWSVLYGTEVGGTYSFNTGSTFTANGFKYGDTDAPEVGDLARHYLANLDPGLATGHYAITYLYSDLNCDASKSCSQNLVTLTPSPVPLPAAMPLMLSGLIGLGIAARRRKSRQS